MGGWRNARMFVRGRNNRRRRRGDERRRSSVWSRRRRSRYRAVAPPARARVARARALRAGARTLARFAPAHLHVLLPQRGDHHPSRTLGVAGTASAWFGENMPCRDGRDGPLNRVRGADARGPVLPAEPEGAARAARGVVVNSSQLARAFSEERVADLRRAARDTPSRYRETERKDFYDFPPARATRRRAADATDAAAVITSARSISMSACVSIAAVAFARAPFMRPARTRRARGAPSRARRVPIPRPCANAASRSRTACAAPRSRPPRPPRSSACAPDAALANAFDGDLSPTNGPKRISRNQCARAALPPRPVARLAFFSRSRTTLTYVASLLGVGERHVPSSTRSAASAEKKVFVRDDDDDEDDDVVIF